MSKQSQNLLNLTQAAEAVGITRKTLYSHIDKGFVSVTRQQGKRYVDVSELIRHYGSVSLPEEKINAVTRSQTKRDDDTILAMQRELVELRKLIEKQQLLLEDK
ncbi:helix-turn-helix domain-containing protein, partial [Klebsiella variicola]|uniref:helix-turn-helix domain-containing protein n=3 Tax=Enterobacterales TaxID=91347 RepID=UPI00344F2FA3